MGKVYPVLGLNRVSASRKLLTNQGLRFPYILHLCRSTFYHHNFQSKTILKTKACLPGLIFRYFFQTANKAVFLIPHFYFLLLKQACRRLLYM